MIEVKTQDVITILNVELRAGDNKLELTVDKFTGDVSLYFADIPEGGGTWHNKPLFVGNLTKRGLEIV